MAEPGHSELIRDQFTRQAGVFNAAATITNEQALKMIVAAGQPGPDDTVLDVACGGGIIVCAFAPYVRHATGIDMTPAMLDQSRKLAAQKKLANTSWKQGDVTTLPFSDASFSIVVTRFSFHHFLDPLAVLKEMMRVCVPGGRIVVVDMYAPKTWPRRRNGTGLRSCAIPATCAACPCVSSRRYSPGSDCLRQRSRFTICAIPSELFSAGHFQTRATTSGSWKCSRGRSRMTVWVSKSN